MRVGKLITVVISFLVGFVACQTRLEDSRKEVKVSATSPVTKKASPGLSVSGLDIRGSMKMPNTCQNAVMEVKFESGGTVMSVGCKDKDGPKYQQTTDFGVIDTSVPALDPHG